MDQEQTQTKVTTVDVPELYAKLEPFADFSVFGDETRTIIYGVGDKVFTVGAGLIDKLVDITLLKQHPRNYRNGDIERIRESLAENGQYRGIVVNIGTYSKKYEPFTILGGNHTYQGALGEGWTHIAVDFVDVDDERADDILLADNATSDAAWNDPHALSNLLGEKQNRARGLKGTGATEEEALRLAGRISRDNETGEGEEEEFREVNLQTKHKCPSCGYEWG